MEVVEDKSLEEITGLVEWPVVLWGEIDSVFFDYPRSITDINVSIKIFFVTRKLKR